MKSAEAPHFFPEGDAEALAAILADLLKDPALRRQTADRCRKRAARFDIRTTTQAYLDLYTRLLQAPGNSAIIRRHHIRSSKTVS